MIMLWIMDGRKGSCRGPHLDILSRGPRVSSYATGPIPVPVPIRVNSILLFLAKSTGEWIPIKEIRKLVMSAF